MRGDLAWPRSNVRVTDSERDRVADRLRGAYSDGALSSEEFEERLHLALAARTRGDLSRLTRDLPRDYRRRDQIGRAALRTHATVYTSVNGGLVALWAVTGGPFWPAGSLVPWGFALGMHAYARRRMSAALRRRASGR